MLERTTLKDFAAKRGLDLETVTLQDTLSVARNKTEEFHPYFLYGDLHLARVPDIVFFPEERLFLAEETWLLDDLTMPRLANLPVDHDRLRRLAAEARVVSTGENAMLMGGCYNFYHWFMNWSTKIYAAQQSAMMPGISTLITTRAVSPFHAASLARMFPDALPEQIDIPRGQPMRFSDVVVPTLMPNPAHPMEIITWLRDLFEVAPPGTPERIYVTRRDSPDRRIMNEDELEPILREYGFVTYALSEIPLAEQVALFQNAKYIISPHGAGLLNLVHCRSRPRMLEVNSTSCYTRVFRSIGVLLDFEGYNYLLSEDVGIQKGNKKDLRADPQALRDFITRTWRL